jgi:phage host-nuclease inhibitor protein Gam
MTKGKSQASAEEWRELEELVNKFFESISDLKRSVGRLETKVLHMKTKRKAIPAPVLEPSPQARVPVP